MRGDLAQVCADVIPDPLSSRAETCTPIPLFVNNAGLTCFNVAFGLRNDSAHQRIRRNAHPITYSDSISAAELFLSFTIACLPFLICRFAPE